MGLAWTALELFSYLLLRPTFLRLLDRNPKLAGHAAEKQRTATQMLPRVVCFVHNVVQIPLGLMLLLDPAFLADPMFTATPFSTTVMFISAGYFLYDTAECALRFEHEGADFLLHGAVCFLVFLNLAHTSVLHWFGAGFLMWELSTPFMHLRWVLYKIGKGNSRLYMINGLLGVSVFFMCRVVWGPILSVKYWRDSAVAMAKPETSVLLPLALMWSYRLATLVMNGLNVMWFGKMMRLLMQAAGGSKAASTAVTHEMKKQH